jgi:hypothetical protein
MNLPFTHAAAHSCACSELLKEVKSKLDAAKIKDPSFAPKLAIVQVRTAASERRLSKQQPARPHMFLFHSQGLTDPPHTLGSSHPRTLGTHLDPLIPHLTATLNRLNRVTCRWATVQTLPRTSG